VREAQVGELIGNIDEYLLQIGRRGTCRFAVSVSVPLIVSTVGKTGAGALLLLAMQLPQIVAASASRLTSRSWALVCIVDVLAV
jgi:hypothetical protein